MPRRNRNADKGKLRVKCFAGAWMIEPPELEPETDDEE